MSLINDALKRAKQAQSRPTAVLVTDPPLEPVLEPSIPGRNWLWIIPPVAVLLLLLASYLLFLAWRGSRRERQMAVAPPQLTNLPLRPVTRSAAPSNSSNQSKLVGVHAPSSSATPQPATPAAAS